MNASLTDEVARYAADVRAALADLPAAEREELLEDLEDHLHEVAADEGSLRDRLGPPQAYAEELRSSAGLAARRGPRPGAAFSGLTARAAELRARTEAHPAARAVLDFLPELRPAWWVLRGYVAVQLLAWVLPGSEPDMPLPQLFGSAVLGLLVVLGAVVGSVVLGRREPAAGRPRLLLAANALLGLVALVAFLQLHHADRVDAGATANAWSEPQSVVAPGLVREDGSFVTNIYPFDASGRPLTGVFLYDQDGRPINLYPEDRAADLAEVQRPLTTDGRALTNVFPQRQWRYDDGSDGTEPQFGPDGMPAKKPIEGPNVGVPKLAAVQPTPGVTLSPSPTPSATPPPTPSATPPPTPSATPPPKR